MRFVVGAVLRSISLLLSYALSTLSAASFLTFVLFLGSEIGWLVDDPLVIGGAALYLFTTWLITAQLVFAPALVAIVTAELARLSSLLSNVLLGGVCAIVGVAASKAAQVALAQSWQNETANIGPAVHIVTPNPMPTATRGRFFPGEDRSLLATPEFWSAM